MLVALALGCRSEDGFVETPDDPEEPGVFLLRAPSLAGCTYTITDADLGSPQGLDVSLAYDDLGRIRTAVSAVDITNRRASAVYLWSGGCLLRIQTQRSGYLINDDFTCDEHDNWTSWVETQQVGPDTATVDLDRTFTNTYDALGQLVQQDVSAASGPSVGLLETQTLLWDGQSRLLQSDTLDLVAGTEVKRTNTWDHERLLGWGDRNIGDDMNMLRYFERHRMVTQDRWMNEEEPFAQLTWTYPNDDAIWPVSRTYSRTGAGFFDQDIVVDCPK